MNSSPGAWRCKHTRINTNSWIYLKRLLRIHLSGRLWSVTGIFHLLFIAFSSHKDKETVCIVYIYLVADLYNEVGD